MIINETNVAASISTDGNEQQSFHTLRSWNGDNVHIGSFGNKIEDGDVYYDEEFFNETGSENDEDTDDEVYVSGDKVIEIINHEALFHQKDNCHIDKGFGTNDVNPFAYADPKVMADPRSYFVSKSMPSEREEMIAIFVSIY